MTKDENLMTWFTTLQSVREHRWFSGRMLACHAGGPGSIPGRCNQFCKFSKQILVLCFWSSQLNSLFVHRTVAETKTFGDGGYRSPYLSHAKRALYHLSYVPRVVDCGTELEVNHPKVKVTLGELSVASSVALLPAAVHIPR